MIPGYIDFGNNQNDRIGTTNKPQLQIAGDLEIILCWQPHDGWQHTGQRNLIFNGQQSPAANRSFRLRTNIAAGSNRVPVFGWWDTGGTERSSALTGPFLHEVYSGAHGWLRIRADFDDGSGNTVIYYWYSNDPIDTDPAAVTWTVWGTGSTTTATTGLRPAGTDLTLGGDSSLSGTVGNYLLYVARLYDGWLGSGGTLVADPDPRTGTQGWASPPAADGVGNSWTLNNNAAWAMNGPSAPNTPTATPVDSTSVLIAWTAPTFGPVASYTVERSDDGVTGWTNISGTLSASTLDYLDQGLTPNTTYYYRVTATNASGSDTTTAMSASTPGELSRKRYARIIVGPRGRGRRRYHAVIRGSGPAK